MKLSTLRGVREHHLTALARYVARNAGSVPLGYFAQLASVRLLGFSAFFGRLSSALCSLVACAGIFVLARRVDLRRPELAVLIFALLPLQFRYALEVRPYAQALALTSWASVLFFRLVDRPSLTRAIAYSSVTLAGLYTLPYSVFVSVAHLSWVCLPGFHLKSRRLLILTASAVAVALLGFVPWYIFARQSWSNSITGAHVRSGIHLKTPLLILRELIGAGYIGSALILGNALLALRYGLRTERKNWFWVFYVFIPILLALVADMTWSYFVAVRQVIFVLAPLSVLATLGLEKFALHRPKAAVALGTLLIAILLYGDTKFLLRPRENWLAASNILESVFAKEDAHYLCRPIQASFMPSSLPSFSSAPGGGFARLVFRTDRRRSQLPSVPTIRAAYVRNGRYCPGLDTSDG